ncbi:Aspartyl protease protein 2 [Ancistrocladus abbreviatus]
MEGKAKPILLSFVFFLSFSLSSSSQEYQILVLNPLSRTPSLIPPQHHQTQTQTQELSQSELSDPEPSTLLLELHHVDSLSVNSTPEELFSLRLGRDALRAEALNHIASSRPNATRPARGHDFSSSVVSGLAQGSGEYFTRLGVGTPPKYMFMVLDTGSDVVWIQCMPCKKCYTQTDPVFNPIRSRSFVSIPCKSPVCLKLDQPGCSLRGNKCTYRVSYGDLSFTSGEFAAETMTFRGTRVRNVALGCGHDNEGLFVGAAGLLGLGRGRSSFPSQTGRRFGRKFSYCLADRSASSKPSSVVFGESAVSRAAVFTPLLNNPKLDTFYYVGLVGISVGGTRVPGITGGLFKIDGRGNGGVIVDSGTSVTRLAQPAYIALRDAFRAGASRLKSAEGFALFDTCYDLSGKTTVRVPTVVMHFNGADVSLPASNYMIPVDTSGRFCFAFAGTLSGLSIIGNIQQQGFRVIFDTARGRVGFAPRSCA